MYIMHMLDDKCAIVYHNDNCEIVMWSLDRTGGCPTFAWYDINYVMTLTFIK